MTLYGQKLSCSAHRERGACQNTKVIAVTTVEQRVVEGLEAKLLAPNAVARPCASKSRPPLPIVRRHSQAARLLSENRRRSNASSPGPKRWPERGHEH